MMALLPSVKVTPQLNMPFGVAEWVAAIQFNPPRIDYRTGLFMISSIKGFFSQFIEPGTKQAEANYAKALQIATAALLEENTNTKTEKELKRKHSCKTIKHQNL